MKKLELTKMENIAGGKLCSDMGIATVGGAFALISGPVGWVVGLGAWIGCSIPRATEVRRNEVAV